MYQDSIIDRTLDDVEYARKNQFSTSDLKGAWNVNDYNRIKSNIIYINDELLYYGFEPMITNMPDTDITTLCDINDNINILRNNVTELVNSFYSNNNPIINFYNTFNYIDANELELNLKITNELLISLESQFKYSGTFYSNQDIL